MTSTFCLFIVLSLFYIVRYLKSRCFYLFDFIWISEYNYSYPIFHACYPHFWPAKFLVVSHSLFEPILGVFPSLPRSCNPTISLNAWKIWNAKYFFGNKWKLMFIWISLWRLHQLWRLFLQTPEKICRIPTQQDLSHRCVTTKG